MQLIRKGTDVKFPRWEEWIEIQPKAFKLLPGLLTRQRFVVPTSDFRDPVDMQGKVLRTRLRESNQHIEIYPEFRLVGVDPHRIDGQKGSERLASALLQGYDDQLPALRELLDAIFRRELGDSPTVEALEKIAGRDQPGYQALQRRVADELGLRVDWILQIESNATGWLNKLVAASPVSATVRYNERLPSMEFLLTFTLAVERASLTNLHRLQRRADLNLSPQEEFEYIFKRVRESTEAAFNAVWSGLNTWNEALVRELAKDGYASVAAKRLVKECGYIVEFSDFRPGLSEEKIGVLGGALSMGSLRERLKDEEAVETELHKPAAGGRA